MTGEPKQPNDSAAPQARRVPPATFSRIVRFTVGYSGGLAIATAGAFLLQYFGGGITRHSAEGALIIGFFGAIWGAIQSQALTQIMFAAFMAGTFVSFAGVYYFLPSTIGGHYHSFISFGIVLTSAYVAAIASEVVRVLTEGSYEEKD